MLSLFCSAVKLRGAECGEPPLVLLRFTGGVRLLGGRLSRI